MSKVPVLVLAFNRPESIRMIFEPIRKYQPDRLYLACDGPRPENDSDEKLVRETQEAMQEAVNWPCEVKKLYRGHNLGCTKAVAGAISWFYENEEFGVIVEDDVMMSVDFFKFAEELLPYYQNDSRIMMIGAPNKRHAPLASSTYKFSTYTYIWGWATWRRAWAKMDLEMKNWPKYSKLDLFKTYGLLPGLLKWRSYKAAFRYIRSGSWDTRWAFAVCYNHGLCIIPGTNLSRNIGIGNGDSANYQVGDEDPYEQLAIGKMEWPLHHPNTVIVDKSQMRLSQADYLYQRYIGFKKRIRKICR